MALTDLMKRRATVRRYTSDPVSDSLLDRLLADAARTPTMGNLQLYSVVVTRDEAMKRRLAPAHFNQPMATEAPVVLTICADFNRTTRWCECRQAQAGYDNVLSFLNAATDALLYTQTLTALAEEAGLGTCFLGTTIYQPEAIIEALGLPHLVMPVATLTLGWPAEEPARSDRLPEAAFVHREQYADYTPEAIDTFYTPKEQLPENLHFVDINGKETLAQVYAEIRYKRSDNEALSKGFMKALQKQGFNIL